MAGLRDELQTIYDQYGLLTPTVVLEEARDPDHALHARFEWDNAIAGEAYRRQQAHDLIVSVRVKYRDQKGSLSDIRAFHAISSPEGGFEYRPVEEIVRDEILTKIVLNDMERDWRTLKSRYGHFVEFAELVRRDLEPSPT